MKGLASFVMRGPSQAVLAATALALLSLILPLFGILSAAVVGLVALRQGLMPGLLVAGFATLASGVFTAFAFGNPLPAIGFLLLQWLPVTILSLFLRNSRSFDQSIQLALVFGLLAIIVQYLLPGSPAEFWNGQLQVLVTQFEESGLMDRASAEAVAGQIASWMGGILAAGLFLQLVFSLLMARWWQALLFNPGGFQAEFHGFRISRILGAIGLAAVALLVVPTPEMPELFRYLGVLMMAILFLQGLAVAHGILAKTGSPQAWLVVLYLLLIFLMPQAVMVLATIGLVDVWIDFRARAGEKGSAGQ
jgi:hypothetical protein